MVFSYRDRIAQILLGYSFGRLVAIGAAAFVGITLLALLGVEKAFRRYHGAVSTER
jgi:hypothetical protein